MGMRFRKSKSFGPVRVTISKSGVGYSIGSKGFRVTKKAGGGARTTISAPGTGVSYTKDYKAKSDGNDFSYANNKTATWAICIILAAVLLFFIFGTR